MIFQEQRLRIPILEEKPFELKAEFETAQAVVPGQGQTIRVAGVRVGDVADVELENGVGVVTFDIDREFLPIYKDATILMRPTTGLKDMFFELDPGTKSAGRVRRGRRRPGLEHRAGRQPRRGARGAGLRHAGLPAADARRRRRGPRRAATRTWASSLGGLGPINEDLRKLNSEVASRQQNVRTLVHNFRMLTGRVAQADDDLVELVSSSKTALGAIAEQDPSVRRAVGLLGPTLSQAEDTLNEVADFAGVIGPTFNDLRPFARNLDEANGSLESLAGIATPVILRRDPPVRALGRAEPVPDLRRAADRYSNAAPRLTVVGKKLNRLTNMAAYNPERRRARGHGRPRRGLPLLGRLAGPQRQPRLQHRRRQRPVPPHLLHRGLPAAPERSSPAAPAACSSRRRRSATP